MEHRSISLAVFSNHQVQIVFSFDTLDDAYNAFEGWYVDNIAVTNASGQTIFSDNVEAGNAGWAVSGSNGVSPGWHITGRRSAQFGQAWWYGNEATGTYQGPTPE